jgi:uridylate kinase
MEEGPSHRERFLLKLSGEILAGGRGHGIDPGTVARFARELADLAAAGYQPGVVAGGGNFLRGRDTTDLTRTTADYMGMLATVINSLALSDAVVRAGGRSTVLGAFPYPEAGVEVFSPRRAERLFEAGEVVFFAGGTGNPRLSTDTAAALRAAQTLCPTLYKGTKVDGVYDRDPEKHPDAVRFERLGYRQVLSMDLGFMDAAAVAVCRDAGIRIAVFDLTGPGNLSRMLSGGLPATVVED